MVNDPEDPRTATVEAEEPDHEGGPVKTFLEHLEDLRWVLIKSLVGLGIGMFICLIGGDSVVRILRRPLDQATVPHKGTNEVWTVSWGTNVLKVLRLTDEQQAVYSTGGPRYKAWQIGLRPDGTNGFLLALARLPLPAPRRARAK